MTVLLCSDVTNDGETGTYFCVLRFSFFLFFRYSLQKTKSFYIICLDVFIGSRTFGNVMALQRSTLRSPKKHMK